MVDLFVNDVEYGQMFSPQVEILLQEVDTMECEPILRIQKVVFPTIHIGKAIINKINSITIIVSTYLTRYTHRLIFILLQRMDIINRIPMVVVKAYHTVDYLILINKTTMDIIRMVLEILGFRLAVMPVDRCVQV